MARLLPAAALVCTLCFTLSNAAYENATIAAGNGTVGTVANASSVTSSSRYSSLVSIESLSSDISSSTIAMTNNVVSVSSDAFIKPSISAIVGSGKSSITLPPSIPSAAIAISNSTAGDSSESKPVPSSLASTPSSPSTNTTTSIQSSSVEQTSVVDSSTTSVLSNETTVGSPTTQSSISSIDTTSSPITSSTNGTLSSSAMVSMNSTTTTSSSLNITVTGYPDSINGQCKGPDCEDGSCTGIFCVSIGCSGSDCSSGICTGLDCISIGCIGAGCSDGVCVGSSCTTSGCEGADCNTNTGGCDGLNCISIGCSGPDCDSDTGSCSGSDCSVETCSGSDCNNGSCIGEGCDDDGTQTGGGADTPTANPRSPVTNPTPTTQITSSSSLVPSSISSSGSSSSPLSSSPTSSASSTSESCDPSLSTATGLCSNGNFPYWDVGSQTIDCGLSTEAFDALGGEDALSSCQLDADSSVDDSLDTLNEAASCCSTDDTFTVNTRRSLNPFNLFRRARAKAACPNLPAVPYFKANPPAAGQCHSTYTCDGQAFPNVCANARSAISSRGRTSILTFSSGADYHDTSLFEHGKYGFSGNSGVQFVKDIQNGIKGPQDGWGLIGCEIEEYPFGSGSPLRPTSRTNLINTRAVNRLIHNGENGRAGQDLRKFYANAGKAAAARLGIQIEDGRMSGRFADGLVYCVDFKNTPTTNDDRGYLLDSTRYNICAEPYGVDFTLVTQAYGTMNYPPRANVELWDPWFNVAGKGRLTQKVVKRVAGQPDLLFDLPPQYCQYPSPGTRLYENGQWVSTNHQGIQFGFGNPRNDPGVDGENLRCIDVPGGNPTKRSVETMIGNDTSAMGTGATNSNASRLLAWSSDKNIQSRRLSLFHFPTLLLKRAVHRAQEKSTEIHDSIMEIYNAHGSLPSIKSHRHQQTPRLRGRAAATTTLGLDAGGSFTDPSAFQNFFCPNDDYDPCVNGDSGCETSVGTPPYSIYASTDSTAYTGATSGLSGNTSTTTASRSLTVTNSTSQIATTTASNSSTAMPSGTITSPKLTTTDSNSTVTDSGMTSTGSMSQSSTSSNSTDELSTTTVPSVAISSISFISCASHNPDPDGGITTGYCVCSSSTFAQSVYTLVTPYNSCGYTTLPTSTTRISTLPTSITTTVLQSTSSSSTSPISTPEPTTLYEFFPDPPYDTNTPHCGVFDSFEAAGGISLSKIEKMVKSFCDPSEIEIVDYSNSVQAPYDLGDGTVFLVGIEYNHQQIICDGSQGSGYEVGTGTSADCVDPLLQIINSCDTTTTTKKIGGSLASGCFIYFAVDINNYDSSIYGDTVSP